MFHFLVHAHSGPANSQSVNARYLGRHYTTRPGPPTVVGYKQETGLGAYWKEVVTALTYTHYKVAQNKPGYLLLLSVFLQQNTYV